MLTVADMGEVGVKNHRKRADVLYGRSLIVCHQVIIISMFTQQPQLLISF